MVSKLLFVALLILSMPLYSCARRLPPFDNEQWEINYQLLERVELFYSSLASGRYDQIEQMAGQNIKNSFNAEALESVFKNSSVYTNSPVVDALFLPFAVTRANVFYCFEKETPYYICEKMIWQHIDDDWYFTATRIDCRLEIR